MTLTVVRPDDLADRLLDRDKHPQWQGERTKMVYEWPANEALWSKYAQLWREGMAADRGITDATDFYRANRDAMDEGADVAWPQRHRTSRCAMFAERLRPPRSGPVLKARSTQVWSV